MFRDLGIQGLGLRLGGWGFSVLGFRRYLGIYGDIPPARENQMTKKMNMKWKVV